MQAVAIWRTESKYRQGHLRFNVVWIIYDVCNGSFAHFICKLSPGSCDAGLRTLRDFFGLSAHVYIDYCVRLQLAFLRLDLSSWNSIISHIQRGELKVLGIRLLDLAMPSYWWQSDELKNPGDKELGRFFNEWHSEELRVIISRKSFSKKICNLWNS
jgi:hypothetical protein